jgi:ATP-dependent DNA helicase RecQ
MALSLENYFLLAELNGRTVRIAKLSKVCRERLDRLRSNGYTPCSAEVRFVVAWKKEVTDEEIPVILSDIHLQKDTAAQ